MKLDIEMSDDTANEFALKILQYDLECMQESDYTTKEDKLYYKKLIKAMETVVTYYSEPSKDS